jgi:tRNA (guanine37-N1)-methyltransferase
VVGKEESLLQESFEMRILDCPHYTRPAVFRGMAVPEVLLSGDHEAIKRWRRKEALRQTLLKRPDLLSKTPLADEEREILMELGWTGGEKKD